MLPDSQHLFPSWQPFSDECVSTCSCDVLLGPLRALIGILQSDLAQLEAQRGTTAWRSARAQSPERLVTFVDSMLSIHSGRLLDQCYGQFVQPCDSNEISGEELLINVAVRLTHGAILVRHFLHKATDDLTSSGAKPAVHVNTPDSAFTSGFLLEAAEHALRTVFRDHTWHEGLDFPTIASAAALVTPLAESVLEPMQLCGYVRKDRIHRIVENHLAQLAGFFAES
jgi:hypothetical protein